MKHEQIKSDGGTGKLGLYISFYSTSERENTDIRVSAIHHERNWSYKHSFSFTKKSSSGQNKIKYYLLMNANEKNNDNKINFSPFSKIQVTQNMEDALPRK